MEKYAFDESTIRRLLFELKKHDTRTTWEELEERNSKPTIQFTLDQIRFIKFNSLMHFMDQFPYDCFNLCLAFDLVQWFEQAHEEHKKLDYKIIDENGKIFTKPADYEVKPNEKQQLVTQF